MANPPQRDDIYGTAASASSESYLARRQGNLIRGSDGFRSPTLPRQPRQPTQQGYRPDEPLEPYRPNPASRPGAPFPDKPDNSIFFRAPDMGAPKVGFPDARRTDGKLQQSGAAYGRLPDTARPVLAPRVDGRDAPPSLVMEKPMNDDKVKSAYGNRWTRPIRPRIYDHLPH